MRFAIMKDDILRHRKTGEMLVVTRGTYTYRFMESQDYEMEAHGMGEYAGSYGGALDTVSTTTGRTKRHKIGSIRANYENITAAAEAAEAK